MEITLYAKEGLRTAEIQKAIDDCFAAGGGKIVLTAGLYNVGGLRLRSNCTLYLCAGAILKGTRDPEDYQILQNETLEPVDPDYLTDVLWLPARTRPNSDHITKAGSRWNNALIRILDAHDVAIIGEKGAVIDGSDCYDATGEEHYRGPHGIAFHHSRNLTFKGYTIQNTGNWAHLGFGCQDMTFADLDIEAGHDGIHISVCDRATITDCEMYTGDDCVAGFDNYDVTVRRCILNSACSAFRFGGADILIEDCKMYGPAKHFFRGGLSPEDKIAGNPAPQNGRKTMLSLFTYYSDFTLNVRRAPKNIVMRNCEAKDSIRFVFYDFSGKQVWQMNKPLQEITFENVTAENIDMPLDLYGDGNNPHTVTFQDCRVGFTQPVNAAIRAAHFAKITAENCTFRNVEGPLIRCYGGEGETVLEHVTGVNGALENTDEVYVTKSI